MQAGITLLKKGRYTISASVPWHGAEYITAVSLVHSVALIIYVLRRDEQLCRSWLISIWNGAMEGEERGGFLVKHFVAQLIDGNVRICI